MKANIENIKNELATLDNKIEGKILYEDFSITEINQITELTLNDDLSKYSYYEILYSRYRNADNWMSTGKIPVGKGTFLISPEGENFYRDIQVPSSGNIVEVSTGNGNDRCIPRIMKGYR